MRSEQIRWIPRFGWQLETCQLPVADKVQLVLLFGDVEYICDPARFAELRNRYAHALIVGCSSMGTILEKRLYDDTLVATAIQFDTTTVRLVSRSDLRTADATREAAAEIVADLQDADQGLFHVFMFADGFLSGAAIVNGVQSAGRVPVTGGQAGDYYNRERDLRTAVCANNPGESRQIVGLGFYGRDTSVYYGSATGWEPFGIERTITRAENNTVFEIDGEPALDLYRRYLGEHAGQLPMISLQYPLGLLNQRGDYTVRSVRNVNTADRSLVFAGDIPVGTKVRFMKTEVDNLIRASSKTANESHLKETTDLVFVVSCAGRRFVMNRLTEEELEAIDGAVGAGAIISGFYSFAELAPSSRVNPCDLHNQTITLTMFRETGPRFDK